MPDLTLSVQIQLEHWVCEQTMYALPQVGDIVPKVGHVNLSKAVLLAQLVSPNTIRPIGKAVKKGQSPGGRL